MDGELGWEEKEGVIYLDTNMTLTHQLTVSIWKKTYRYNVCVFCKAGPLPHPQCKINSPSVIHTSYNDMESESTHNKPSIHHINKLLEETVLDMMEHLIHICILNFYLNLVLSHHTSLCSAFIVQLSHVSIGFHLLWVHTIAYRWVNAKYIMSLLKQLHAIKNVCVFLRYLLVSLWVKLKIWLWWKWKG